MTSVDSLPKIVCDCAKIKMKGDTTPMRVLLVVDSSTGCLGAADVDQKKVAVLVSLQNGCPSGWSPLAMHERKCNPVQSRRLNTC